MSHSHPTCDAHPTLHTHIPTIHPLAEPVLPWSRVQGGLPGPPFAWILSRALEQLSPNMEGFFWPPVFGTQATAQECSFPDAEVSPALLSPSSSSSFSFSAAFPKCWALQCYPLTHQHPWILTSILQKHLKSNSY